MLREVDGTIVFVDISGFTKMSERLARNGKVGAEEVTDVDRLGVRATALGRLRRGRRPDQVRRRRAPAPVHRRTTTRSGRARRGRDAQGPARDRRDRDDRGARSRCGCRSALHSGTFHFFLVGESHRELIITGPAATETVVDGRARPIAGEILVSQATAQALPPARPGQAEGRGRPAAEHPDRAVRAMAPHRNTRSRASTCSRASRWRSASICSSGASDPEHRQVTVAFIHFDGTDELIRDVGAEAVAYGLDELVSDVQAACDEHGVTLPRHRRRRGRRQDHPRGGRATRRGRRRGADAARAPRDRRRRDAAIPIRIGVNRGPRVRGRHRPSLPAHLHGDGRRGEPRRPRDGEGRARARSTRPRAVLERSARASRPTRARAVHGQGQGEAGPGVGGRRRRSESRDARRRSSDLPLVGRETSWRLCDARSGRGRDGHGALVEIVGEPGIGKTRLLEELRERADGLRSPACDLRGVHRVDALRRSGASCSASCSGSAGRTDDEVVVERLPGGGRDAGPDLAAVAAADRVAVRRRRCRRRPRSR